LKINTVPVEAYRQASNQTIKKNQSAEEQAKSGQGAKTKTITLPGLTDAEAVSIKAPASPSLLEGVLSTEEKTALVKHFARFGDSQDSSQIYGTNARTTDGAQTGIRLDVRG
jgi:hypothetical protein